MGCQKKKNLIVQNNKVLAPEAGWFERPSWAFHGPYYYMKTV